jgi:hypothetical protein
MVEDLIEELSRDPHIMTASRLGEAYQTNPLGFLDVDPNDWVIVQALATALQRDAKEREAKRGQGG